MGSWGRRMGAATGWHKGNRRILETARESIGMYCVQNWLWRRLRRWENTDYRMMMMMMILPAIWPHGTGICTSCTFCFDIFAALVWLYRHIPCFCSMSQNKRLPLNLSITTTGRTGNIIHMFSHLHTTSTVLTDCNGRSNMNQCAVRQP